MEKRYKLNRIDFFKIKHLLDGRIFWKELNNDMIEIKTSSLHAHKILDQKQNLNSLIK